MDQETSINQCRADYRQLCLSISILQFLQLFQQLAFLSRHPRSIRLSDCRWIFDDGEAKLMLQIKICLLGYSNKDPDEYIFQALSRFASGTLGLSSVFNGKISNFSPGYRTLRTCPCQPHITHETSYDGRDPRQGCPTSTSLFLLMLSCLWQYSKDKLRLMLVMRMGRRILSLMNKVSLWALSLSILLGRSCDVDYS